MLTILGAAIARAGIASTSVRAAEQAWATVLEDLALVALAIFCFFFFAGLTMLLLLGNGRKENNDLMHWSAISGCFMLFPAL
jgi:hypothetical protein